MKKLFILFLIYSCTSHAQDTIRFRNGGVSAVKVNEITDNEIKYLHCDNLTGPSYVVEINDVKSIHYKNGQEDIFSVTQIKAQPEITPAMSFVDAEKRIKKIEINGKTLKYNRRGLDNDELFALIDAYPDVNKKNILIGEFNKVKTYKDNHGKGLVLLFGGMLFSVVSLTTDSPLSGAGFALGTGASIFGSVIANMNRNKHNTQRVKVAQMYNDDKFDFR